METAANRLKEGLLKAEEPILHDVGDLTDREMARDTAIEFYTNLAAFGVKWSLLAGRM